MNAISAVVITYNEEASIRDCLDSLSFANEIIVVDSNSTDRTVSIAREYTDNVYSVDWTGFAAAKNYGIDQAKNDWILSVDADERVSDTLKKAIQELDPQDYTGFWIARRTWYLGRWIQGGGWYPDRNIRLFNRQFGRFRDVSVHESVKLSGEAGILAGDLLHYSYRDISDHVHRIDRYSDLISDNWLNEKRSVNLFLVVLRPVWEFCRKLIMKGGFRDGYAGIVLAGMHAFYTFLKYVKTYERKLERQINKKDQET